MKIAVILLFLSNIIFAQNIIEDLSFPTEPGDQWFQMDRDHFRITVARNYDGEIYLYSRQHHQETLEQISYWTIATPHQISYQKNGIYRTKLTPYLPQWLRDIIWSYVYGDEGSNCWNLSLFSNGLAFSLFAAHEDEFTQIMNSSLCYPLLDPNDIEAGDIAAFRAHNSALPGDFVEIHGATVFSRQLFLTKNGASEESAIRIQDQNEIFSRYLRGLSVDCTFQVGTPTNCRRWINYFRCSPLDTLAYSASSYLQSLFNQLTTLGQELVPLITGEEHFSWITHSTFLDFVPQEIYQQLDDSIFFDRDTQAIDSIYDQFRSLARKHIPILAQIITSSDNQELAKILFVGLVNRTFTWNLAPEHLELYKKLVAH